MDVEKIKQRSSDAWSMGEYTGLSEILRPAAVALCDACAVSAGQEVLDVAAGDGNFALACAAEGASVVASDLAPGMVEKGRARAHAEGFDVEWLQADVEDLPFEDGRFECVGSVFGAMIAPRPRVAAEQLFRVTRPGNTVGMTAWAPEGFAYELFQVGRRFEPRDEGLPTSEEWADRDTVAQRFDGLANSLEVERASLTWSADSPEAFVAMMERHAPTQATAKAKMDPDTYARLRAALVDFTREQAGGDGPLAAEAPYVVIVARRRG